MGVELRDSSLASLKIKWGVSSLILGSLSDLTAVFFACHGQGQLPSQTFQVSEVSWLTQTYGRPVLAKKIPQHLLIPSRSQTLGLSYHPRVDIYIYISTTSRVNPVVVYNWPIVWEVPYCGSCCFFHQFVGSHHFIWLSSSPIIPNGPAGFSFAENSQDLFPSGQITGTVNDDIWNHFLPKGYWLPSSHTYEFALYPSNQLNPAVWLTSFNQLFFGVADWGHHRRL